MSPTHLPVSKERLVGKLDDLFELGEVEGLELLPTGYMCQNFELACGRGRFFLKQYRNQFSQFVSEVKYAERFFASRGVPVILPVSDRFGRPCFWFEGNWWSLFPFVEGTHPDPAAYAPETVRSLAKLLARMHLVGTEVETPMRFQRLHLWSSEAFDLEFVELEQALLSKPKDDWSELDRHMLAELRAKRDIVKQVGLKPGDLPLANDRLLHGDFIYQNTFVAPDGEVSHVFDFEKACFGPRAYDLARAILINCFDDGWEDRHFTTARAFLAAYREDAPIGDDELLAGLRMYMAHLAHTTWVEAKYILFGSTVYLPMHASHMRRLRNLQDFEGFMERVAS